MTTQMYDKPRFLNLSSSKKFAILMSLISKIVCLFSQLPCWKKKLGCEHQKFYNHFQILFCFQLWTDIDYLFDKEL